MAKPRKRDSDAGAARAKPRARRRECPSRRSSAYRGVTRHRWTGRFEAHLWDKDARHGSGAKKGRQVYLGAYDDEAAAARAHDLAALKYWGPGTALNFPLRGYGEELREMDGQPREEYIGSLRRKSSGFSRGVSKYRGVARHHHNGRWEARIGRVLGNKYLYLGTFATQEAAAVAYDVAAIEHRGINAVTNFDISHYVSWHRRRQGLGGDGLDMDAAHIVPFLLPPGDDPAAHGPASTALDGTAGVHQQQQRNSGNDHAFGAHLPGQVRPAPADAPFASSALDLLLQSPKFKEMMEQVSAAASEGSSSSSASPSPSPPPPSPGQQPEFVGGAPTPCSFPDDVQTYFECDDVMSFAYEEVDTFLFGDLGAYAAPMFQCELDLDV